MMRIAKFDETINTVILSVAGLGLFFAIVAHSNVDGWWASLKSLIAICAFGYLGVTYWINPVRYKKHIFALAVCCAAFNYREFQVYTYFGKQSNKLYKSVDSYVKLYRMCAFRYEKRVERETR